MERGHRDRYERDALVAGDPSRRVVLHLGVDDRSSSRVRVVDAALRCLARHGIAKTTVDDVAREAGFSRATLYRQFPGGKDAVVQAVVETEAARLFSSLGAVMGEAEDLETLLVRAILDAATQLSSHEAIGYLLAHEPGKILPHLTFSGLDRLLRATASFAAPYFGRWLEPEEAARAAEWAARIVVSYLVCPDDDLDLTDPRAVERLVATFVVPGIQALGIRVRG
ncbi:MAG: TetR/AcrR family transcriptional regulator [Acidimicrobiales bacterium]